MRRPSALVQAAQLGAYGLLLTMVGGWYGTAVGFVLFGAGLFLLLCACITGARKAVRR